MKRARRFALLSFLSSLPALACSSSDPADAGAAAAGGALAHGGAGGASPGGAAGKGSAGQAGQSAQGGKPTQGGQAGEAAQAGQAGQSGQAGFPAALPTGKFRIGMWCGPPASELTAARFVEIAEAGFTTVSNACDGSTYVPAYNLPLLSLAHDQGLDAVVADQRIQNALAGADVAQNLDAVVADYAKAPALAGYFLGDEPGAGAFAGIASVAAALDSRDAAHFSYTNLLPDYASAGQLGTTSYDDYVGQFLAAVKPRVFSWDYYPFLTGGVEQGTFFADMAVVRAHALATQTPFWQFTQAISFNGHRATNRAEKSWVGMQTLAYGGAGISYFTYWTPPQTSEVFGDAIIDASGTPSSQYADVKAINARLSAFGRYLVASQSTGVFENGALSAGMVPRVPGALAYVPTGAPLTVGLFAVGDDAYVFLVNRSYDDITESDVVLAPTAELPEELEVPTGHFASATTPGKDASGYRVHVSLPPGDATLFHLRGPLPAGPPGAEAFVGTVRSDAGTLDVVDSSFGAQSLRPAGWNDCPAGYTLIGTQLESNGFWVCARGDLANRTFQLGNVVKDAGALFSLHAGTVTSQGAAGWDTCPGGQELGKRFESNGYWLCLEP